MRNMIKTYDKDSSLISKGLLAIFLLIHHLFGNDAYTVYNIDSLFNAIKNMNGIVQLLITNMEDSLTNLEKINNGLQSLNCI